MIELQYAIAAQRLVRDAQTNTISAFDILEEIQSPTFPLLLQRLDAVAVFERTADDPQRPRATVTVKLDEDTIFSGDMTVDFDKVLRTRSLLSFAGMVIQRPGVLFIEFTVQGENKGRIRMPVQAVAMPAPVALKEGGGPGNA